ncbi:hypothetical protein [Maricaulis sp.]|uniref:hypothetical protein n=1 Tax=Maricaulis sp. TaxID=1486257 RepID=UPI002629C6A2|nr:hypothetical protein [Maricaulis sp.]
MTDLLAAFIEWLAVLAMSLVGIEYTPAVNCDPQPPVEFETVEYLPAGYLRPAAYSIDDRRAAELELRRLAECDASMLVLPVQTRPVLVEHTRVYDS